MYVLLPGESDWEKFYLMYKDNSILFMTNIRNNTSKYSYAISGVIIRQTTKYINVPGEKKLRKIGCLMLCHSYDTLCMFLTLPMYYESQDLLGQFNRISRVLAAVREKVEVMAEIPNPYADETNRISWGKLKIQIGSLRNFPYYGTIFVKVSLTPWQFKTKKIMDSRLDFFQSFYVPVANNWFTIKVDLINY
jgi:hypothetical protein